MVRDIDRTNVGLLLDTFHMNIEEKDIPARSVARAAHIRVSRLFERSRNAGRGPSAVARNRQARCASRLPDRS